jgi:membrane-bound ClpP family serine protease
VWAWKISLLAYGMILRSNIQHFIFKHNRIDKLHHLVYPESVVNLNKGVTMNQNDLKWERVRTWLLWLALPLVIGILIASFVPKPVIGIIRLEDAIYSYSAQDMIKQIKYASEHPEVRAVVLAFDSPGGTVVDTEAVYMELAKLREKKPVVTAINGMAASGAYYLSVGTDYIYAKPSSMVGNIGVISYLPPPRSFTKRSSPPAPTNFGARHVTQTCDRRI